MLFLEIWTTLYRHQYSRVLYRHQYSRVLYRDQYSRVLYRDQYKGLVQGSIHASCFNTGGANR